MSANVATEETLIIETPERVPLHFALASIGNRFLACAIDHTIQVLVIVIIALSGLILASATSWESTLASAPKWVIAIMVLTVFLIFTHDRTSRVPPNRPTPIPARKASP